MDCNVVKDLIPLYIDGCCSEESEKIVKEHIENCDECKNVFEQMNMPSCTAEATQLPAKFSKLNDWKASVLQSVLLFASFLLITVGVAMEAHTPYDDVGNGFWAYNIVVPATGFMLSLANWYFVRVYKSRKAFSNCSWIATLAITLCASIWSNFHYEECNIVNLFVGCSFTEFFEVLQGAGVVFGLGIFLTVLFCVMSKVFSDKYAKMLGKE